MSRNIESEWFIDSLTNFPFSLVQTVLWILKDQVPPTLRSAGEKIVRAVAKGQQEFDKNSDTWPLGQAVPKLESTIQVAGEHYS